MDTAVKSLKHILESPDYERIDDIAIFDEHEEYDFRKYVKNIEGKNVPNPNYGKLLRKFDKKRLEEIVAVCNKRRTETGDLAPVGPGHLIPGAQEINQPPVWGFAAGEYRVGCFGPQQKLGILTSLYMKKQVEVPSIGGGTKMVSGRQALQEFPRRSVELWHKDSMIDWIALLRQTPERDLGLTAAPYCKERFAPWGTSHEVFFDAEKSRYARSASDDTKLRYSMGQQDAPDDPTKPPDSSITPADQPLSPQEEQQAERFMCHYMKKYAWMAEQSQQYSAMMSATNTGMPAPAGGSPKEPEMDDTEKAAYQKQIDDQKAQIDKLTGQVQTLIDANLRQSRVSKYSKDLNDLAGEGYVIDVADELSQFGDLPDEKWTAHVERIKKCYKKTDVDPTNGHLPFIQTKSPRDTSKEITQDETDEVLKLMRKTGLKDFDEAVTQYRKAN